MDYQVLLIEAARKDYDNLDGAVKKQAKLQLQKLKVSPELGESLGTRMGIDLTGYRSLHFYKNQYRIVFKVDERRNRVIVVGIGRRESAQIYEEVSERLKRNDV